MRRAQKDLLTSLAARRLGRPSRRLCRAAVAGLLLAGGCIPAPAPPPELTLLQFRQDGKTGVYLDEPLVFHFSDDLDVSSITSRSVLVTGPDGASLPGSFQIKRSTLEFHPALPRRADLSDGTFQPGTAYKVVVAGFPCPDGVRGRRGEVLGRTSRHSFVTVMPRPGEPLFQPVPGAPPLLRPTTELSPLDPILLTCNQAIDPRTLKDDGIELRRYVSETGDATLKDFERLPIRIELAENRPGFARLRIRALGDDPDLEGLRTLGPGEYYLNVDVDALALRDVAGRKPRPRWTWNEALPIRVSRPGVASWLEDFDGILGRRDDEIGGFDGTAAWDGSGAVRVRLPAAVGSGEHGHVELFALDERRDLHATELVVPAGATCDLSAALGLVVLRSQGALEIRGRLVRGARPNAPSLAGELEERLRGAPEERPTFSAWLASVLARDLPWTVLVAGGDLRITGELAVEGPLVLVAGGWIRISGRAEAAELWKTADGGENARAENAPVMRSLPLLVDEPETNPLKRPLRVAVGSDAIRPEGGVARWRQALVDGRSGQGGYRVRFQGLRDLPDQRTEIFGPLEDLDLLEGCQAVRFAVELVVDPAPRAPWDPPYVDAVTLSWVEPAAEAKESQERGG